MTLRKIVITSLLCGILSPLAGSAKSLPKEHLTIAREETAISTADPATSFIAMATEQSRLNSPFATMPEILKEDASIADASAAKVINYAARFLGTRYVLGAMGLSTAQDSWATCSATSESHWTAPHASSTFRAIKYRSETSAPATSSSLAHAVAAAVMWATLQWSPK